MICLAIGEIGGSLYDKESCEYKQWPELQAIIQQMLLSKDQQLIESAYQILAELFSYSAEAFAKLSDYLLQLFTSGMQNPERKI